MKAVGGGGIKVMPWRSRVNLAVGGGSGSGGVTRSRRQGRRAGGAGDWVTGGRSKETGYWICIQRLEIN